VAVYQGSTKRRKTTIVVAVATLVVGLVIGIAIGRASAPSFDSEVAKGRDGGRDLVTSLRVLPLEYGQALSGSEGTALIGDTVDRVARRLDEALDGAPWLGPAPRATATKAVAAVKTAATAKVPPAVFQATIDSSSATLQDVFGLPRTAGG